MTLLRTRVYELVSRYGSYRAAAKVLDVDEAYLFRLGSGEKNNPGTKLLKKLGLRMVKTFERIKPL